MKTQEQKEFDNLIHSYNRNEDVRSCIDLFQHINDRLQKTEGNAVNAQYEHMSRRVEVTLEDMHEEAECGDWSPAVVTMINRFISKLLNDECVECCGIQGHKMDCSKGR